MKVIVVLPYLTSLGGATRYGWELSEYLARQGDNVIIASLHSDKNIFHSKESIQFADLADEVSFPQSVKYWLSLGKIRKRLSHLVKDERPDVIIFINFPTSMWASDYGDIPVIFCPLDIQLLYSSRADHLSLGKYWLWRILRIIIRIYEKKKWQHCNEVIAISKFTAKHISKVYKINPTVIYCGTDTKFFIPNDLVSKEKVILLMADHKTRRVEFFLTNIRKIYQKRKDFEIWIVGSKGDYHKKLTDLVTRYDIDECVKFFGRVSNSKLVSLYSKSLVFVHLQKIHSFGLVFIEAMSCGTPVIACKPGATEEIIQHGETGFLIHENDSNSLINCVEKLLDDPDSSIIMGRKGRLRVEKFFENSTQYKKIRNLMIERINKKS